MNKEEIYTNLQERFSVDQLFIDEPMKKHTSFKVGGNADFYIKVKQTDELEYILDLCNKENIEYTIVGNGSNLLVKDNGINGIVIKIDNKEIDLIDDNVTVEVGAGTLVGAFSQFLLKNSLTGFEFASGIPGTLGGAVRMNAGAYGSEMKDIILSTTYIAKDGQIKTINNKEHEFKYRHSRFCDVDDVIWKTTLKLEKGNPEEIKKMMDEYFSKRKESQPYDKPSAGSTFKRGEDFITAKLIDDAGLKGYRVGDAMVSDKHAGFVVNMGNATSKDILTLIDHIKKVVKEKFDKDIKEEIEIIGE